MSGDEGWGTGWIEKDPTEHRVVGAGIDDLERHSSGNVPYRVDAILKIGQRLRVEYLPRHVRDHLNRFTPGTVPVKRIQRNLVRLAVIELHINAERWIVKPGRCNSIGRVGGRLLKRGESRGVRGPDVIQVIPDRHLRVRRDRWIIRARILGHIESVETVGRLPGPPGTRVFLDKACGTRHRYPISEEQTTDHRTRRIVRGHLEGDIPLDVPHQIRSILETGNRLRVKYGSVGIIDHLDRLIPTLVIPIQRVQCHLMAQTVIHSHVD